MYDISLYHTLLQFSFNFKIPEFAQKGSYFFFRYVFLFYFTMCEDLFFELLGKSHKTMKFFLSL